MSTTDGAFILFFQVFFAEFLGFETNVISTHHRVTFHALVVSSPGHDFELNFILAHCVEPYITYLLLLYLPCYTASNFAQSLTHFSRFKFHNDHSLRCL